MDGYPPLKLALIGDTSTGKTSLLFSFVKGQFPDESMLNSLDMEAKVFTVDSETFNLTIIDTSGSSKDDRIRPMSFYYPAVDVFLVCYSINNRTSFEQIKSRWIVETQKHCPTAQLFLVGTKNDLRMTTPNIISEDEVIRVARAINASGYLEISSKSGQNVQEVFAQAVRIAKKKYYDTKKR